MTKYYGPYRAKHFTATWEVVSMVNNFENSFTELNPRRTYPQRSAAVRRATTLNKQWQRDHETDYGFEDMLEYWKASRY